MEKEPTSTETAPTQPTSTETAPTQPTPVNEPRIIYVFDIKSWYESMSPLTKLDLLDVSPIVSSQFYYDNSLSAYVLVLVKSKWDTLSTDFKKKFMFISRRLKEEMEGPMSTLDREKYESSDIFELVMAQQAAQQPESLETISEDAEPTIEELNKSITDLI